MKRISEKMFSIVSIMLPSYESIKYTNIIKGAFAKKAYKHIGSKVNWGRDLRITGTMFSIGDRSSVGTRARIQTPITIGDDVMMGADVRIFRTNHRTERTDIPMHTQGTVTAGELIIENDVWICDRVIITPGCSHIGSGSILAAGAVVTKNVGNYEIWGGNPAVCIKKRRRN